MRRRNINIDELLSEYELDTSIFSEVDERLLRVYDKWSNLSISDKTIIILYAEYHSYRTVGDMLGIRHTTCARFIKNIRKKIC